MHWQDWVFAVGGLLVLISLIPTIKAEQKPALTTGLMTTVLVLVFASTMLTLHLWLAAVTNYAISAAWALLAVQAYQQKPRGRSLDDAVAGVLPQIEAEIINSLPDSWTDEEDDDRDNDKYALSSNAEAGS